MKLGRALATGVATERPQAHGEPPVPAAEEGRLPAGATAERAPAPAEVPAVR
ncbi:hypothetical protein ACIQU5_13935 [Streptomyces sp. NPDC090306]|uniref:hypothetical protein n=1 Tax=unclassified Streptomyces TaxID=2593676 RepID=UPI0036EF9915